MGHATPIVIACGRRKATRPAPAPELYTGSLFRAASRSAVATGRPWLILSARHGLLDPATIIAPYEATITNRADIAALAELVASQHDGTPLEAWVPARYLAALRLARVPVTATPLAGLGIGQQLAWFIHNKP